MPESLHEDTGYGAGSLGIYSAVADCSKDRCVRTGLCPVVAAFGHPGGGSAVASPRGCGARRRCRTPRGPARGRTKRQNPRPPLGLPRVLRKLRRFSKRTKWRGQGVNNRRFAREILGAPPPAAHVRPIRPNCSSGRSSSWPEWCVIDLAHLLRRASNSCQVANGLMAHFASPPGRGRPKAGRGCPCRRIESTLIPALSQREREIFNGVPTRCLNGSSRPQASDRT